MYQKMTALALALLLATGSVAMAKKNAHDMSSTGGYIGTPEPIVSVKEAVAMPDDSMVRLQGQIEKKLKKDKYLFKDASGSVVVEIDKDIWRGQTVTPTDTVTISGEVDKDWYDKDKVKIEVDELTKQTSN